MVLYRKVDPFVGKTNNTCKYQCNDCPLYSARLPFFHCKSVRPKDYEKYQRLLEITGEITCSLFSPSLLFLWILYCKEVGARPKALTCLYTNLQEEQKPESYPIKATVSCQNSQYLRKMRKRKMTTAMAALAASEERRLRQRASFLYIQELSLSRCALSLMAGKGKREKKGEEGIEGI